MKVDIDALYDARIEDDPFLVNTTDNVAKDVYVDRGNESIVVAASTATDEVGLEFPVDDVPKLIDELKQAWQSAQDGDA